MPIILENTPDNGSLAAIKPYSPKFFNSNLTGSGKSIGILCEGLNPAALTYTPVTTTEHVYCKKEKYVNGKTSVNKIPVNPLTVRAWRNLTKIDTPDKVATAHMAASMPATMKNKTPVEFFTIMKPHSVVMEETDLGPVAGTGNTGQNGAKANKSKKVTVCYQICVYAISDWNEKTTKVLSDSTLAGSMQKLINFADNVKPGDGNAMTFIFACDAVDQYAAIFTHLENHGYNVDRQSIADYLNNYSIYDAMVKRSEEWQTTIQTTTAYLFESIGQNMIPKGYVFQKFDSSGNLAPLSGTILEAVTTINEQLEYMETYNIPLDLYRDIYNSINQSFDPSLRIEFCKHNLNLLLSDTLYSLNNKKSQLAQIHLPPNPKPPVGPNGTVYSPEQTRAITCTDPLVLIQAGAGTGKSTTILARVNWMIANGVNPKDIMIISFTNAAADNIMTKNPYIQSMTIAKMIHTIYSVNFPQHELSTAETLGNTLDIYYPNDPLANQFRKRVSEMEDKKSNDMANAYTQMNNFVERHLKEILAMLDGVKQTTLALEIIICYQMINQLQEPPEIASKYLIIDEVQDNSVFEFIYSLKYVDKHNEAMLIVGDCSQTLYEFRASNPKALNVLEGSDVFTTHKLQINYRSNQEILDFANVLLENIEANQYARIQLQANSLKTVTEQSFLDAVKFHYHRVVRAGDITDELPMLTRTCLKPYVDDCIAKKEQVAVLAFTRKNITAIQEELQRLYPKLTIADITSSRSKPSTLFSNYIRHEWNNLAFAPTQNLLNIIVAAIQTNLSSMIGHSNNGNSSRLQWLANAYARQLYDWQIECGPTISAWQQQFNNGQITREQFMDFVKENMLQYEIRRNAVKQAMLSSKKRDRSFNETVQNADILISTVHGAKGLEFPHVILLFQSSRDMSEDAKRVYYVGLTRAMKSEYVLAYDTIPSPKVKADYETIIKTLHQRHPAGPVPAMPLVTGVPTKNQFCASIEDIEKGVIKLKPGLMPEAVIANPDDPAAAQAQLDAQAAANQVITNAQNQILAQNQTQATATPAQAPAQTPFPQPVNTPPTPNTTPAPKGMPTPPVHSTWPQPAPTTTVVQPQANQMPFTQSMRPGQAINPVVNVQRPTVPTAPVVQVNAPATPVVKKTSPFPFNLPSDYLDQIKKSQPPKPGQ